MAARQTLNFIYSIQFNSFPFFMFFINFFLYVTWFIVLQLYFSLQVSVHLACYRRCKDPISSWYCEPCEKLRLNSSDPTSLLEEKAKPSFVPQCGLCGTTGGAFRMSTLGQWVHAFCAEVI